MTRAVLALVLAVAFGCSGGNDEPTAPTQALRVGTYNYSATLPWWKNDGTLGQSHYSGTLTLNHVSNDSIGGTWNVVQTGFSAPRYEAAPRLGHWSANVYLLWAAVTSRQTVAHQIGKDLSCTAKFIGNDPQGSCTLSPQ